uniref:myelin-associated neurite-outgrowth inhibitor-like n=1 Tax=Myxine glutinosa TaxID=7769 RepID=UPI00358FD756
MNPGFTPFQSSPAFLATKGSMQPYPGYPAAFPCPSPAYPQYPGTPSALTAGIGGGFNSVLVFHHNLLGEHHSSQNLQNAYSPGTPYKPTAQMSAPPPPYSPTGGHFQPGLYPARVAYTQAPIYTQGPYYAQPVYAAAPPHVIHHTTVVQPNGVPHLYSAPVPAPRPSSLPVGMVAGTAMAMSAGTLLATPPHTSVGAPAVPVPTYRPPSAPYGYASPSPPW